MPLMSADGPVIGRERGEAMSRSVCSGRRAPGVGVWLLLVGLMVVSSASAARVEPGGVIRSLTPDPVRTGLLYVATDTPELVVVDVRAAEVLGRMGLPGDPTSAAVVSDDASRLWLGFQFPAGIVGLDLGTLELGPLIELDGTWAVRDLASGRPGRLYAARGTDGVSIIDTERESELALFDARGTVGQLAVRSDGSLLYAAVSGAGGQISAFELDGDDIRLVRSLCCDSCVNAPGEMLLSLDEAEIYLVTGGEPGVLRVRAAEDFEHVGGWPLGTDSNTLTMLPSGCRLYANLRGDHLAVVDAATGLTLNQYQLPGFIGASGMAAAADGSWLAVAWGTGFNDPATVELLDPVLLEEPTLGGVLLRPIDDETGLPVQVSLSNRPSAGPWHSQMWFDRDSGEVAWGAVRPGEYTLTLRGFEPYEETERSVVVRAGEWTRLGTVGMTRIGPDEPGVYGVCALDMLTPGVPSDVRIRGMHFRDGPELSVDMGPDVEVHEFRWLDWRTLSASVTPSPTIPEGRGYQRVRVVNPGGAGDAGHSVVGSWPPGPGAFREPGAAPAAVPWLRLEKTAPPEGELRMRWAPVDTDADGLEETTVSYRLLRSLSSPAEGFGLWRDTRALEHRWPERSGPWSEGLTFYLVRPLDGACQLGD